MPYSRRFSPSLWRESGEEGNAPVGFLANTVLLVVVFLGVIQLALTLHQKTVVTDVATQSAQYGARFGNGELDAQQFALETSKKVVPIDSVETRITDRGGKRTLVVSVSSRIQILGALQVPQLIQVKGHAIVEEISS